MNDVASLTRQVLRGSKTNELLDKATKNFAYQESAIENSSTTLKKMGLLVSHLQFQGEAIERSVVMADDIQDQLKTIRR
ncbi:BLOC-1-related complex subunit 7 [Lamellibrachia satsuma]|nr:BLOC-1-related complex subunit 7 [Lamellibrachia satsuma]